MPYIKPEARERLDPHVRVLIEELTEGVGIDRGEFNYVITRLLHAFVEARGGLRYAQLNDAVGIIECAKLELYRVVTAPYEDEKVAENGPITQLDGAGA